MKLTAFLQRHYRWVNLPGAILMMILQRAPAVNVVATGEEMIISSPVGTVLKSALAAVAALGAVNSMAGATQLTGSQGSTTGITVTVGTAVSVSYTLGTPDTEPDPTGSWTIAVGTGSSWPPGLSFSGLSAPGTVDVKFLQLSGTPTAAGTYVLKLTAKSQSGFYTSPTFTYTITVNGSTNVAPSITTQPTNQAVTAGASASFTAAASGTPTPTLQWQRQPSGSGTFTNLSEGGGYTGTTSGTLTVGGTTTGMSGDQFRCVATNTVSSATSNAATLTVNAVTSAPGFSVQPSNQTVTTGGGATFSVVATGGPAPTLKWQRQPAGAGAFADLAEGGSYTGTTSSSLTVGGTVVGMSGDQFRCVATNASGSATSNPATLTVNPVPVINSISYNSTNFPPRAKPGAAITFTYNVTNTGTNAWGGSHFLVLRDANDNNLAFASLNGVAPGASTTASLSFTAPATPGSYTYYVQGLENNVAYFADRATLPLLVSVGLAGPDFNGDGQPDVLWTNTTTGDRAIWFLNGTAIDSFGYVAGITTDWSIVGTGDFNADGHTDLVWENTTTGDRTFWLMNGLAIDSFGYLAFVDPVWHIAALGDFNGDGQSDVIWENTSTGDRAIWYLNGMAIDSFGYIAGIATDWHIVGAGDFDGDGKTDLVWENRVTGDRTIWFMDNTAILSFGYIANIPGDWHIAMVSDFNADGKPDLLWENTTTGDRAIWLMDGANQSSAPYFALVDPVWRIAP